MGVRGPKPFEPNWLEFEKLISMQATDDELAAWFGVCADTINNACLRVHGAKLSDFRDKKKLLGRLKLRKLQFESAEKGDTTMQIYLGKVILGQKENPTDLDNTMQALGLTPEQVIEIIKKNSQTALTQGKKSFTEFCVTAGYPPPFEKQIEMMQFGINQTDPRMLLGARKYGKTDYVVICGIAYDIYINPLESTNLVVTKSKDRSAAIVKEVGECLVKNGVVLKESNSSNLKVQGLIGKDPSLSAVTLGTASFRGRHPKRIFLDDPVTEDDTSEATRKRAKKKWNEILKLSKNVCVIGQPAHKFDLYADLRALAKFLRMEVPWGSIPELDDDLEAQLLAGVSQDSIDMSYHLKIPDEGTTPFDNINYLDKFPLGESAIAWIDPSHEGGDFTALTIMRQYMDGIAIVGFVYKKAWNHCLDEMVKQIARFNVKRVAFETNALGDQPIIMLRQLFDNTGIGVVGKKSIDNKHAKIMNAGAFSHLIHLSRDSHPAYIEQVTRYEYGAKNDDAPDSLASLLQWVGLIRGK